ncbi:hypothetical protein [Nocardia wallacei]|uniref:hypothetical protein n=1 Tax=Nocardia wallacei TaxID=480035 RepID=UPI0024579187|nr:hypothetical protein [Nocardia wallacei]
MSGTVIRGPWPQHTGRRTDTRPREPRRSTAWADTLASSGEHCTVCGRVFASGHVPHDEPVCRECRPVLFDPATGEGGW